MGKAYLLVYHYMDQQHASYFLVDNTGAKCLGPSSRLESLLEDTNGCKVNFDIPDDLFKKAKQKNIPGKYIHRPNQKEKEEAKKLS